MNSASITDPSTSATSQSWDEASGHASINAPSELDFNLVWPDSEDLFQTLMSSDTADRWQMPFGSLPFPPDVQDVNMNFGSPNPYDTRGSSVGGIPTSDSHQAVRDVTEMVTSSVSLLVTS